MEQGGSVHPEHGALREASFKCCLTLGLHICKVAFGRHCGIYFYFYLYMFILSLSEISHGGDRAVDLEAFVPEASY